MCSYAFTYSKSCVLRDGSCTRPGKVTFSGNEWFCHQHGEGIAYSTLRRCKCGVYIEHICNGMCLKCKQKEDTFKRFVGMSREEYENRSGKMLINCERYGNNRTRPQLTPLYKCKRCSRLVRETTYVKRITTDWKTRFSGQACNECKAILPNESMEYSEYCETSKTIRAMIKEIANVRIQGD